MSNTISWPLGSHTWQAPDYVGSASVSVAAGGGGGFSDNAGPGSNGRGGGGGSGGANSGSGNLVPQAFYYITVGGGGGIASAGGPSSFNGPGLSVSASGGGGGQDRPGGAAGQPGGSAGSGDGSKEAPGDGSGGVGGGGSGGPGNIKGTRGASPGNGGYVTLTWSYAAPTASLSVNGSSVITAGQCTNLLYSNSNTTSATITNYGPVGGGYNAVGGVEVCPSSTTTYTHEVSGPGGTATGGPVTITVYPVPSIDTFYISDDDHHIGDTVTVYWTTSNASYVGLSGSAGAWGSDIPTNPRSADSSHTFIPTTGGFYSATLTVKNAADYTVTSTINWKTRDETPNAFSWADSEENTPLNNENLLSNSITINGFGPTQYASNALPIKSNHPIQVQIAGDEVWRNVEQI